MLQRSKIILITAMVAVLTAMVAILCTKSDMFSRFGRTLSRDEAALRYPYSQLTRREQRLYTALCKSIENYRDVSVLPDSYSKEEYERVYLMAAEQEPQFFYLDDVYETAEKISSVNLFYDTDKDDIKRMRAQMNVVADRILRYTEEEPTEAQKLERIHDEIAKGCEYADGPHQNDAYGCLVNGKAKCEGYAKAFLYVARRGGFHVMNVTGTIRSGGNHVWNIAEIDGHYYNIDVTWDDDTEYKGNVVHSCFAVPDWDFEDHYADLSSFIPPVCTNTEQSWYTYHDLLAEDTHDVAGLIGKWKHETDTIEFKCEDEWVYQRTSDKIQADSDIRNAVKDVSGAVNFSAVADETRRVIIIMPA